MRVVGAVLSWIARVWVPRAWFWSDHQSPAIQGALQLDIGKNHSALDFHTPTGSRALRSWSDLTDRYWPFSTVLCGNRNKDIVPMPLENLDTQPTIRWYVLCRLLIEHNFITRCEEGKGQAVERLDDNRKLGAELSRKESAAKLGSHHGTST